MYTTGTYLVDVDLANDEETGDAISVVASAPQNGEWKIGLAEFAAGEEMDRYDGFWWSPDSKYVLFETYDESPEPIWHLSDPANPTNPAQANRYPQALTANADVRLTLLELGYDSDNCCYGAIANEVQWDHESYEYLAAVSWREGHDPIILVQDRLQQHDQVLAIHVGEPIATMRDAENGFTDDNGDEVETFSIAIPEYAEGERPGTTRVLEEHGNDYWLDLIHGTPAFTPDGRLICAMNDMDVDTNRLTVDGTPFTPAGLQVREVLDVMLELADSGQTMLIVTHEMQFARAIADQVILLEDGGIVERSDDAERFFTNPTTERAKQFLHTFEFDRHRKSAEQSERSEQ